MAGWCLVVGALLAMVLGIALAPFQSPDSPSFGLVTTLNAVDHLLFIVGIVGLVRSKAAGHGGLAVAGRALTLAGLGVLVVAEFVSLIDMSVASTLFGVATLSLALGLILAGVAVLRAGRWVGWRRFTPLACGLYIPLVLFPSFALPGLAMHYALGLWGVPWLLLGMALLAERASVSS
jgi:hypothetical protein